MAESTTDIRPRSVTEPRLTLRNDEDEITHLVCCRESSWTTAFCGEPADRVNLLATMLCSLCVEVAGHRRPGWSLLTEPPICPDDGRPCPDEHELDRRVLREVSP